MGRNPTGSARSTQVRIPESGGFILQARFPFRAQNEWLWAHGQIRSGKPNEFRHGQGRGGQGRIFLVEDLWNEKRDWLVARGRMLLESHRHWTGRDLIGRSGDLERDARNLFEAPLVVVSGGAEEDQVLNYANLAALDLWEMDWDTLVRTPSRHTAEPVHRDERAEFLRRVRENGFVDDYSGIRISSRGRRFRIERATVWNVIDEEGDYAGQAATFSSWEFLP